MRHEKSCNQRTRVSSWPRSRQILLPNEVTQMKGLLFLNRARRVSVCRGSPRLSVSKDKHFRGVLGGHIFKTLE
jgi:hypothetical protein